MDSIVTRIRAIAKDVGIGEGKFEERIGVSVGYLNITEKRGGDPGASVVLGLLKAFPEYSLKWIFTKEGPMKLSAGDMAAEEAAMYKTKATIDMLVDHKIEAALKERVEPKIKEVYSSIDILMRRDLDKMKTVKKSKRNNG